MRVGVFMGGKSNEREVSLKSGKNVVNALQKKAYQVSIFDPKDLKEIPKDIDIAFLTTHGRYGEDGCLQGMLEVLGIPYTGSSVLASALAMNKKMMKTILFAQNIPTPQYALDFIPPLVIKPINEGSSLGVSKITDKIAKDQIAEIIKKTQAEFGEVIIEKMIIGREITVGILDDEALPILEIVPKSGFYDYQAKYTAGATEFLLPAPLDDLTTKKMQKLALLTHKALACSGFSRVDIMLDKDLNGFVIDVNTLPGLTDQSDLPAAAKCAGISFEDLIEKILLSALQKKAI